MHPNGLSASTVLHALSCIKKGQPAVMDPDGWMDWGQQWIQEREIGDTIYQMIQLNIARIANAVTITLYSRVTM